MRKIITTTFVTLDGVMQAPGGSDEDREGDFAYGGWQTSFPEDKDMAAIISGFFTIPFELLLGKTTYDVFAAYWPKQRPIWRLRTRLILQKNTSSRINLLNLLGTTQFVLLAMS
jgi:hypothetical protein